MAETKIEWVIGPDGSRGHTINPIRFRNLETGKIGHHCQKISPGCANCYASTMQKPYLSGLEYIATNRDKGEMFLDEKALDQVMRRKKPTGYFWCDMTDLFGDWVPDKWIDRCFAAMALTPQHRHFVLTKRADRMRKYLNTEFVCNRIFEQMVAATPDRGAWSWPGMKEAFRHIWLGVSVEDQQRADERIPHLLATPAAVRFLSVEPLLGPVNLNRIEYEPEGSGGTCFLNVMRGQGCSVGGNWKTGKLDWVIVGGESGPGARPMHPDWVRSIRNQCIEAGVPFFFKQWGAWQNGSGLKPANDRVLCNGGMLLGMDLAEADYGVRSNWQNLQPTVVSRVGKKEAGRLLDGRTWDEMPEVCHA